MTPQDAARVLAVACGLDARLTPPTPQDAQARAALWAAALHPDMPPRWAEEQAVAHYRRTTDILMPAHLNEAYRAVRDRQRTEEQRADLRQAAVAAVPMPADFHARALGGSHG
jgi:hypothetical protein